MSRLKAFEHQVSSYDRARGQDYANMRAVRILSADETSASARITETRRHTVYLDRVGKSLFYSCDCSRFDEDGDICKHVWAALIALEKSGHLEKWKPDFPVYMIPELFENRFTDATDDADEYFENDFYEPLARRHVPLIR
jgi:hypothetical protein